MAAAFERISKDYLRVTLLLILTLSTSSTTTNSHSSSSAETNDSQHKPADSSRFPTSSLFLEDVTGQKGQITPDLIHQIINSAIHQLDEKLEINADTPPLFHSNETMKRSTRQTSATTNTNTNRGMTRNVDIRLEHALSGISSNIAGPAASAVVGNRTGFGRQLSGFEDSNSNVMIVPKEMLQESLQNAQADWLTRQRSIESLWINSGGSYKADPRSPVGTAYGFSAPNQHSLALSNTSSLFEMASREFMKNMNPEMMSGSKKRISKRQAEPLMDMNAMSESMMRVNVQPFFPKPDMSGGSCGRDEPQQCDRNIQIRSFSGVCNNLANPNWGRSVVTLDRMLPPVYADGISVPRMHSVTGQPLPSPRYISSSIHIDSSHLSQRHTMLLMQYGQFLDHDISLTPVHRAPNGILNCRDCSSPKDVHPECYPIQVPFGDTYYPDKTIDKGRAYCIPFTRSLPGQQRLGPREQINQNSGYIDGSQIYGENICRSMALRGPGGYLNSTFLPGAKVLMPQTDSLDMCKSKSGFCFNAGDSRASEQPALAAVHTTFLREHNRLVEGLRFINPHWNEERLYQQSRRILIATNQHIAYNEFLPRILGATVMNAYDLNLEPTYYYTGYDPACRGEIFNEFSTAAFRFGHSLVRPQVPRMNDNYHGMNPTIQLRDGFFNSDMLMKPLMIDEILRGLLAEPMEQLDPFVTNEITNHLFEDKTKAFSGMDLVSINIQRGRDHGLQGYNAYRAACNLKRAYHFGDFASEIPSDVIDRLKVVYTHVDDVDLFTGSLVERPVTGGLVGPTMSCIIGNQFRRLRKCDRFWFETNDPVLQFTPQQLAEIRKTTLAKVLCDNFDVPSDIQKSAFDAPHNVLNPRLPCERLPKLNLEAWRDNFVPPPPPPAPVAYVAAPPPPPPMSPPKYCNIGGSSVQVGGSGMSSPCVSCICTPEGTKCASLRIINCGQLMQQNQRENVLGDSVCTNQCGHFLLLTKNPAGNYLLKSPSRFHNFFKKSFDLDASPSTSL